MKKELTKNQKYAIKFLKDHGFEIGEIKFYISKIVISIKKDQFSEKFDLQTGIEDIRSYMEWWYKNFYQTWIELQELKKKVANS